MKIMSIAFGYYNFKCKTTQSGQLVNNKLFKFQLSCRAGRLGVTLDYTTTLYQL